MWHLCLAPFPSSQRKSIRKNKSREGQLLCQVAFSNPGVRFVILTSHWGWASHLHCRWQHPTGCLLLFASASSQVWPSPDTTGSKGSFPSQRDGSGPGVCVWFSTHVQPGIAKQGTHYGMGDLGILQRWKGQAREQMCKGKGVSVEVKR